MIHSSRSSLPVGIHIRRSDVGVVLKKQHSQIQHSKSRFEIGHQPEEGVGIVLNVEASIVRKRVSEAIYVSNR
jgi:hypothetical protein